jgi:hypothetical protein
MFIDGAIDEVQLATITKRADERAVRINWDDTLCAVVFSRVKEPRPRVEAQNRRGPAAPPPHSAAPGCSQVVLSCEDRQRRHYVHLLVREAFGDA